MHCIWNRWNNSSANRTRTHLNIIAVICLCCLVGWHTHNANATPLPLAFISSVSSTVAFTLLGIYTATSATPYPTPSYTILFLSWRLLIFILMSVDLHRSRSYLAAPQQTITSHFLRFSLSPHLCNYIHIHTRCVNTYPYKHTQYYIWS